MKCAYIKNEMVLNILRYLNGKEEIPFAVYKVEKYKNILEFAFGCETSVRFGDINFKIFVPKLLKEYEENLHMLKYQRKHGFDYEIFMLENNMDILEVTILFALLHEIGHSIENSNIFKEKGFDYLVKRNNKIVRRMNSVYREFRKHNLTLEECCDIYRSLGAETFADKKSIELIYKYKTDLVDIIKDGVIIGEEDKLLPLCLEQNI